MEKKGARMLVLWSNAMIVLLQDVIEEGRGWLSNASLNTD